MRILHVTDFHFRKRWYAWLSEAALGYDLVCFTGDFLEMFAGHALSLRTQAEWVEDWLHRFRRPLIGCLGNHDQVFHGPGGFVRILGAGDSTRVLDHNFLCWPWKTSADLPEWPLIVLSHAPPSGIFVAQNEDGDIGDPKLSAEITRLPRGTLVLSGHNHVPRRWYAETRGKWCLNPGCNLEAAFPNHIEIDTIARTATFRAQNYSPPAVRLYHPDPSGPNPPPFLASEG